MTKQRDFFTEEELDMLTTVSNSFYDKLGQLAAEHIAQMPEDLEDATTRHLQDACSIYSTKFDEILSTLR